MNGVDGFSVSTMREKGRIAEFPMTLNHHLMTERWTLTTDHFKQETER
jgi:hypothetical protein